MSSTPIQVKHYNMGQASGHAIITDDAAIVIDGGYKRGAKRGKKRGKKRKEYSNAETILNDVQEADPLILIATHFHQDHTSGLTHLCERLIVDDVYAPRGFKNVSTSDKNNKTVRDPLKACSPTPEYVIQPRSVDPPGRVTVEFLLPPSSTAETSNFLTTDDGLVAHVRIAPKSSTGGAEVSLLFFGDLSRYFQKHLQRNHPSELKNADGITLPHHGSKENVVAEFRKLQLDTLRQVDVERAWKENESQFRKDLNDAIGPAHLTGASIESVSAPVLEHISPDNIVISADPESSYAHPDIATIYTVASLQKQPKVWATFRNGDITWDIKEDGTYTITPQDRRTNGNLDRLIRSTYERKS